MILYQLKDTFPFFDLIYNKYINIHIHIHAYIPMQIYTNLYIDKCNMYTIINIYRYTGTYFNKITHCMSVLNPIRKSL